MQKGQTDLSYLLAIGWEICALIVWGIIIWQAGDEGMIPDNSSLKSFLFAFMIPVIFIPKILKKLSKKKLFKR